MQPMIIPDYVMTKHDYTGLGRIMTDHVMTRHDHPGLAAHAHGHIAAKGRMFPARNARRFICIEIIGRRGIGHKNEPDISKAIDRHQRIPPGARVPAGDTHEVPHQPRPEERPDVVEIALEVRMHARKDEAAPYQTNSDTPPTCHPGKPAELIRDLLSNARTRNRVPDICCANSGMTRGGCGTGPNLSASVIPDGAAVRGSISDRLSRVRHARRQHSPNRT